MSFNMKVVGFNGSARKNGNTTLLIQTVLQELQKQEIETELIEFAGKSIYGCNGCRKCFEKNKRIWINPESLSRRINPYY